MMNNRVRDLQISIHALREEGDLAYTAAWNELQEFLSTPSARRATIRAGPGARPREISIHALREEGDLVRGRQRRGKLISIHALREEGDADVVADLFPLHDFYPRPPRGGRQQKQRQNLYFLINYTTFCTNLEEP